MRNAIKTFIKNEDGLTTLEYVALAFGILLAAIGAVRFLGASTKKRFDTLNNEMTKTN